MCGYITKFGSWLTPSIFMWVVGIEFGLLSFHGRRCTHRAISPAPRLLIFYMYLFNVCAHMRMCIYVNTHGLRCTCGGQTTTAASSPDCVKFQGSIQAVPGLALRAFTQRARKSSSRLRIRTLSWWRAGRSNVCYSWLLEGFRFDISAQNSPLPTGVLSSSGG